MSKAKGSSGGVRNPPPKFPFARLGCNAFTDFIMQSARFFSFLEQTWTVGAAKDDETKILHSKISTAFGLRRQKNWFKRVTRLITLRLISRTGYFWLIFGIKTKNISSPGCLE